MKDMRSSHFWCGQSARVAQCLKMWPSLGSRAAREESDSTPIPLPMGTSLIEEDSIEEATWLLDLMQKTLPDLEKILRDGSLKKQILKGTTPKWDLLIEKLHEDDACTEEEAVQVDHNTSKKAIKLGAGAFGVIYRRKAQNEVLKVASAFRFFR